MSNSCSEVVTHGSPVIDSQVAKRLINLFSSSLCKWVVLWEFAFRAPWLIYSRNHGCNYRVAYHILANDAGKINRPSYAQETNSRQFQHITVAEERRPPGLNRGEQKPKKRSCRLSSDIQRRVRHNETVICIRNCFGVPYLHTLWPGRYNFIETGRNVRIGGSSLLFWRELITVRTSAGGGRKRCQLGQNLVSWSGCPLIKMWLKCQGHAGLLWWEEREVILT